MKGEELYVSAFMEGYDGEPNIYILTSNVSDAYMLGKFHKEKQIPIPKDIRKSRGYTWICGSDIFHVDGENVTVINKQGL